MKLRITVEGMTYEVDVEVLEEASARGTPAPSAIHSPTAASPAAIPTVNPAPAPALPSSAALTGYVVEAPIVGTIMELKVTAGDTVAVNQVLLVMEAMKMETNIASPIAGKIKSMHVSQGQAVKAGQVLVEFE